MRPTKSVALMAALMSLGACVTGQQANIGSSFRAPEPAATILLMDPDVKVNFVTTGGTEVRADWSQQAEAHLVDALRRELAESGETVIVVDATQAQSEESQQALLLNQAVTEALGQHVVILDISAYVGPLPHQATQAERYTLGEAVRHLAPGVEADYALFLTSHSYIESAGLFMTNAMIYAVTGVIPPSQNFRGNYMSLVDLNSGEVVWLDSHYFGDPRNAQEAASIISGLLDNGPLAPPAE